MTLPGIRTKRPFDSSPKEVVSPSTSFRAVSLSNGAVEPLTAPAHGNQGQSLIETALILPLLLLLAFDAINFGYFFFTAVNVAASPRQGVEYSIQGFATPSQPSLPPAQPTIGTCPPTLGVCQTGPTPDVCTTAYCDMAGALPSFTTSRVQVCTEALGLNATGLGTVNQIPNCAQYGTGSETYTPAPDPEAPFFVLQRVDVVYQITPLIPQFTLPVSGGIPISLLANLRIHRQVSMRAMN
jgi:TadE-like protein